jgi:alpha-tubulin suppressor-like RCC1 family protein
MHISPKATHQKAYLKGFKTFHFNQKEFPNFVKIPNINENIRTASCGSNIIAIVTFSGKVYTYGPEDLSKACLGREDLKNNQIKLFDGSNPSKKIIGISCGPFHTIAYSVDNKVYSWG